MLKPVKGMASGRFPQLVPLSVPEMERVLVCALLVHSNVPGTLFKLSIQVGLGRTHKPALLFASVVRALARVFLDPNGALVMVLRPAIMQVIVDKAKPIF